MVTSSFAKILSLTFRKDLFRTTVTVAVAGFGTSYRNMTTFIQKLNPLKGVSEWTAVSVDGGEGYDYHLEIARAAYADMLHDHDRNMRYYEGLENAILGCRARGEKAIVLDIGTGSGLLSMMAASLGADQIFACEAFTPMAACAARVIARNGYTDRITLIKKRSTELVVGVDLPHRANILITEVFDTELIGEGAITTFNHAHKHLLTDPCSVVPCRAVFYAQVVNCEDISKWNTLEPIHLGETDKNIKFPKEMSSCYGIPSVQDLQLSELKDKFVAISDCVPVFEFDWESNTPIKYNNSSSIEFTAQSSASSSLSIFSWWDLEMSSSTDSSKHATTPIITMRPSWTSHSTSRGLYAWRDHWMQCGYTLPPMDVVKGTEYTLNSYHDEFSLWFSINSPQIERPLCHCGVHMSLSRSRIGLFNDRAKNDKYVEVLKKEIVRGESVVLVLSEGSSLGFIAAGLGAKTVILIENQYGNSHEIMKELFRFNNFTDVILLQDVSGLKEMDLQVDIVVGDPFYRSSVLPWDNLHYWYALNAAKASLKPDVKIFPSKATIEVSIVQYRDLWKIRAPVNRVCNGEFDLADFDALVLGSSDLVDSEVSGEYLWEYPCVALSKPNTLMEFDLTQPMESLSSKGHLTSDSEPLQPYNGLALWMNWEWTDQVKITTGPLNEITVDQQIQNWDKYNKQGVFLFPKPHDDTLGLVEYNTIFNSNTGEITFSFK